MELFDNQHSVGPNRHYSASVRAAIARILTHDQWIWLRDESAPCEDSTMSQAIRQAISRFSGLFGALTGAFSGQETQNTTRAKVLLSAIIHTLTDPTLKSSKRRHRSKGGSCDSDSDSSSSVESRTNNDASFMKRISGLRTSFAKRKPRTDPSPSPKAAKIEAPEGILPLQPASLTPAKRSQPDQAMDTLSTKLASSFYALCIAPGSQNCQRRFLKRHIMVTLALLRRNQSPGTLASEWVENDLPVDLAELTDSTDASDYSEESDFSDTEKWPEPLVISPISKVMAVSAVLFALEVRYRIKLSLLMVL